MPVSKPRGMKVPLLYSELFGQDNVPTKETLRSLVRQVEWRKIAMQVTGILSISWQEGIENPEHQQKLVLALTKDVSYFAAIISRMKAESHRILFSREGLIAVLRVATTEGSPGDDSIGDHSDVFTKAVLVANEIIASEIMVTPATGTASDLLPSELRSAILQLENPFDLLARSDAFFAWSRTQAAKGSGNYLDVETDLVHFTGLNPREYAAGAYFTFARYAAMVNWAEVERLGVAFTIEQWQQGMANTDVVRRWLAAHTVLLEAIRTEWRGEPSLSFAALGTLWRCPVVQVEADLFFAPVPALIQNRMGDGAFFALFDGYCDQAGNDPEMRRRAVSRFTGFYGEFFEDHVASIFERGYKNRKDAFITREVQYRKGAKSTDVIIREGDDIIFVEIVSKRMNLRESVLRLRSEQIAKDIEDGVLAKAAQIQTNVDLFRSGKLLPDWPRPSGQRFFPVIVAPHDRPRITIITMQLEDASQKGNLLAGLEPLELLDLGEVEQLETCLRQGISLSGLLDRKNRSTREFRLMPLHNYLIYEEPGTMPAGMSPTRERGSVVAKDIMALAESWREAP